jgi:hypothetical protein
MFRSNWLRTAASLRAAAVTTVLALTAASAAQAAVIAQPNVVEDQTHHVWFQKIDDPNDITFNQLLGINNKGVISGYFGSGQMGHPNKGYTIAPPYTDFDNANVPKSKQTQATGIDDDGVISGFWSNTNTGTDANFGFLRYTNQYGKHVFVSVNNKLVSSVPPVNQLLGVQENLAAGFYNDVNGAPHGYVYNARDGRFWPVDVKGAVSHAVTGINKNHLVCGFFTNTIGHTHGFVKSLETNFSRDFHVVGSPNTQFLGINKDGIAVGFFIGADKFPHGLVYNANNGNWITLNDPYGAQGTTLNGINDKNQIVGFYVDANGNTHGVLITGLK